MAVRCSRSLVRETVLFFGSAEHPVLTALAGRVSRAAYVVQEDFPVRVPLTLTDRMGGRLGAIDLDAVKSVCLDGFYVDGERFQGLSDDDRQYAQNEAWAALIALFGGLSRTRTVANFVRHRLLFESRVGRLGWLAGRGLSVPPTLVTSNPGDARRFCDVHEGRVRFRTVTEGGAAWQAVTAGDLARLDVVRLSPAHFEAILPGPFRTVFVVGERAADAPTGLAEACRALGLWLATFTVAADGTIVDFHPHLTATAGDAVLDAAAALLEAG